MKLFFRLFFLFFLGFISNSLIAQIENPIKWKFESKKINDCEYELQFIGTIDNGWHIFSLFQKGDGPTPSSIDFEKNKQYERVGGPSENKPVKKYDDIFELDVAYFEKSVLFKQKIKLLTDQTTVISGTINYQACTDSKCNFETSDFEFKLNGSVACIIAAKQPVENLALEITGAQKLPEQKQDTAFQVSTNLPITKTQITDNDKPIALEKSESNGEQSSWRIWIKGFIGGLLALLTPCVFPMIPLTVSFFTKRSKSKAKGITNALLYGISIIVIYVSLGLGVSFIFGSDALNALSTEVWFNLFFFLLLLVFAASFLGAFEIVLPAKFVNKVDKQSDRGGVIGIFFMAMTLSLVSFSCTGPVIGPLLVDAAVNGGVKGPFMGMLGFSMALALPFALFAFFPGWLNSLPKSGGWLNSVKVTLGFLELAFAFKFASNADLVVQAGILTRELFLVIWIVIFGLLGAYLMGWFKLSHDSELKFISVPRLFFAILVFSFTVYLIPGIWGAPLKLISGFPPPDFYSESPAGFNQNVMNTNNTDTGSKQTEHCPNQLPCFHDYEEALAYAKKVNKPLMIDFTGWACVNCRKMEEKVWTNPEVDKRLRNEVVLVSLYVDDKRPLPAEEQTTQKLGNRTFKIKTVGNKWSYLQASVYKTNSQPQYVLLDHNERMLTKETEHYNLDVPSYIRWLDEGIQAFKSKQ